MENLMASTLATSMLRANPSQGMLHGDSSSTAPRESNMEVTTQNNSTLNGVMIGLLSSFGSALLIVLIFLVIYFFKYTAGGRIILDRIGRPGEYDDEQAFLREESEALEEM
jgi:hypothetical protein